MASLNKAREELKLAMNSLEDLKRTESAIILKLVEGSLEEKSS
ncbi:MAG TPA: hypothetical protein VJH95_00635 [Candidatus Nanoarchaeia archaeon]|nr:hypothetical protein [Candidatus Nanoarchaeia archaeon]